MNGAGDIVVSHHVAENRYEATVQNHLCVADYVMSEGGIIFTHTFVPSELRGQTVAEKIVRFALADTRAKGLKIVPACSYVARFIERHPEYHDLLA